jgi:hypothetical protein
MPDLPWLSNGDWQGQDEKAIDFTHLPPTDQEMGWEASETFFGTGPVIPNPIDWSLREEFDERIMTKLWAMGLRTGRRHAQSSLAVIIPKPYAQVVAERNFDDFTVVYEKPPERHLYTGAGIRLIVPSADTRYEDLPPDPLSDNNTDISHLLGVPHTFVDSKASMIAMLDALATSTSETPLTNVDLEGLDLERRKGETYLLQIYDAGSHTLYIIDIWTLVPLAFVTPARDGEMTLEAVLQSSSVRKLLCDVRGDSYALFRDFGIRLQGIKDLQNIQMASRRDPTRLQR